MNDTLLATLEYISPIVLNVGVPSNPAAAAVLLQWEFLILLLLGVFKVKFRQHLFHNSAIQNE